MREDVFKLFRELLGETVARELAAREEQAEKAAPQKSRYTPQPIRQKGMPYSLFAKMRKQGGRAKPFNEVSYREQFLAQAKYMASFEDRFSGYIPSGFEGGYYDEPMTYSRLDDARLRSYFTWRTRVRGGDYAGQTDEGYLTLYMQELLSGVGATDAENAIRRLGALTACPGVKGDLYDSLMSVRLNLYGVCEVSAPFGSLADLCFCPALQPGNPWMGADNVQYAICLDMGDYDLKRSRFYSPQTQPLIQKACGAAMRALGALFEARHIRAAALMFGPARVDTWWRPFRGFLCEPPYPKRTTPVRISDLYWFDFQAGSLRYHHPPSGYVPGSVLLGYVLKRAEARTRECVRDKYRLNPNAAALERSLKNAGFRNQAFYRLLSAGEVDRAIDEAVKAALTPPKPAAEPAIRIDRARLDGIREAARATQELLTVEEAEPAPAIVPEPTEAVAPAEGGGWTAFAEALSEAERGALLAMLDGDAQALRAASERAGTLEAVLVERINELALACAGDNAVDAAAEPPSVYDEYRDEIEFAVRGSGSNG